MHYRYYTHTLHYNYTQYTLTQGKFVANHKNSMCDREREGKMLAIILYLTAV